MGLVTLALILNSNIIMELDIRRTAKVIESFLTLKCIIYEYVLCIFKKYSLFVL